MVIVMVVMVTVVMVIVVMVIVVMVLARVHNNKSIKPATGIPV